MKKRMRLEKEAGYREFFGEIKNRIRAAQYDALKAVNKELIGLYWDIGRMIVHRQEKNGWGKGVVANLAADLQKEFPGVRGYSRDNLWRMRKFHLEYRDKPKLAPLVQEIGWAHNLVILESCEDDLEREFYIKMTRKFGWSKNVLIHHIGNKSYQKPSRARRILRRRFPSVSETRRNWRSRTNTPLIFSNSASSTAKWSWNGLSLPG